MPACPSLTKFGAPCRFPPRSATGLCINHDPAYRNAQRQNVRRGAQASANSRHGAAVAITDFDLSTGRGLQEALTTVVRMELAGKLPIKRARDLLRAISLAADLFPRNEQVNEQVTHAPVHPREQAKS
jgi:hypothetical protein